MREEIARYYEEDKKRPSHQIIRTNEALEEKNHLLSSECKRLEDELEHSTMAKQLLMEEQRRLQTDLDSFKQQVGFLKDACYFF